MKELSLPKIRFSMKYEDIIDQQPEECGTLSEPVIATCVATAPQAMTNAELIKYCREHLDAETLKELEENNFFMDSQIPSEHLPKNEEEWKQMAQEADESGYISGQEFFDHISRWNHVN